MPTAMLPPDSVAAIYFMAGMALGFFIEEMAYRWRVRKNK
jgi:hypothetical protein